MTLPDSGQQNNLIHVEGNTLTVKLGEFVLSLKIESPGGKGGGRLRLEAGQTLFDLVLEAAGIFISTFNEKEFSAADLYHIAREKHPDLEIRRNSWASHVMSSSPNHPSYRHYTSHRKYFCYHGRGKYSLEPGVLNEGITNLAEHR